MLEGERAPLLEGAVGWLECGLERDERVGDHTWFVGRVERAEAGRDAPPLIRLHGDYAGA